MKSSNWFREKAKIRDIPLINLNIMVKKTICKSFHSLLHCLIKNRNSVVGPGLHNTLISPHLYMKTSPYLFLFINLCGKVQIFVHWSKKYQSHATVKLQSFQGYNFKSRTYSVEIKMSYLNNYINNCFAQSLQLLHFLACFCNWKGTNFLFESRIPQQ